jgi:hypothetical protein
LIPEVAAFDKDAMPSVSPSRPPLHPREGDPEFRKLPVEVKRAVREGWRQEAERDGRMTVRLRERRKHAWIEGAAVFASTELLFAPFGFARILLGALVGWGVGEAWSRTSAGQLLTPLVAIVAFGGVQVLWWLGFGAGNLWTSICGTLFVGVASSYIGLRREQRPFE